MYNLPVVVIPFTSNENKMSEKMMSLIRTQFFQLRHLNIPCETSIYIM